MQEMEEIIETFGFLDDWESKYQYLIELGEKSRPLPAVAKIDANKVQGCVSQVWVVLRDPDEHESPERLFFLADSETPIIKGIVVLLTGLASNLTPEQVLELDFDHLFEELRFDEALSPNRHIGIYAIVEKMRKLAQARLTATP